MKEQRHDTGGECTCVSRVCCGSCSATFLRQVPGDRVRGAARALLEGSLGIFNAKDAMVSQWTQRNSRIIRGCFLHWVQGRSRGVNSLHQQHNAWSLICVLCATFASFASKTRSQNRRDAGRRALLELTQVYHDESIVARTISGCLQRNGRQSLATDA